MKILSFLIFYSTMAPAALAFDPLPQGCGQFQIAGMIVADGPLLIFKSLSDTKEETKIQLPGPSQLRAAPYVQQSVLATVVLKRAVSNYRGSAEILEIRRQVTNPLAASSSGFKLVKSQSCLE